MNSTQAGRLFEVLGDETALTIFRRVHETPRSAKDLRETCDASLKTIYRRLELLQEVGLVSAVTQVDGEGNHYSAYATTVEQIEITVEPSEPDIEVAIHDGDDVNQFIGVWTELRN